MSRAACLLVLNTANVTPVFKFLPNFCLLKVFFHFCFFFSFFQKYFHFHSSLNTRHSLSTFLFRPRIDLIFLQTLFINITKTNKFDKIIYIYFNKIYFMRPHQIKKSFHYKQPKNRVRHKQPKQTFSFWLHKLIENDIRKKEICA